MIDIRPVCNVIGYMVAALGVTMLFPFAMDVWVGNHHWPVFLTAAMATIFTGIGMILSTANVAGRGLSLQQTFLLTTSAWVVLPIFGAIPFIVGSTQADLTSAYFEAMSGLTTTGATVFAGLDDMPSGLIMWRAILQWLGGVGIIVFAMVFLPELRVGGMQIFRSEGFDTFGKILPRAAEIASRVAWIYIALTVLCTITYLAAGMRAFDALVHAMTTVSTGGFAAYDASFGVFGPGAQYGAVIFMILSALPFVRFVQMVNGDTWAVVTDRQVSVFLCVVGIVAVILTLCAQYSQPYEWEQSFRHALFNSASIVTGTGYASTDYGRWGAMAIVLIFFAGLVGGCAGSTACSVKIFRYQLLFEAARQQIRQIHTPSAVLPIRYAGRVVSPEVMNSVLSFFVVFVTSIVLLTVALSLTGLDLTTSLSGAATAIANIGPGLGNQIGPSGNFGGLNDTAKWLLCFGMLLGRLEIMAVLALFTTSFWRV